MELSFKKNIMPHIIAFIAILSFGFALFSPVLEGSRLVGPDTVSAVARYKYINDYLDETGETSRWNPSQFSGDPRVMKVGKEHNLLGFFHRGITLNFMYTIGMFFALGFALYISLCLIGVNNWLSLALSLAYMLSYTFFTLYEAGHGQKIMTLIYSPFIISGTIMLLGNKKLKGIIALLIGTSLSIYAGHVQMVYYLILALSAFGIPLVVFAIINKNYTSFFKGLTLAILVAIIAALTDFSQLKTSYDFSKQTMRGGEILNESNTQEKGTEKDAGLKWDYAMGWSFEPKEFLTTIVPRIVGGGSQEKISKDNPIAKLMLQNGAKVKDNKVPVPGYWGNMAFTSGGAYIGASVAFVFIFSFFLIERKYAFAFGAALLMIFLLSLGKNAEWFNRFLFENLPMFSKFRAPSSVISILPAFVFLQVGMGLNEVFKIEDKNAIIKKLLITCGASIAFLLIVLGFGYASFSFLSPNDLNYDFNIQSILKDGRKELFKADITRSLFFVISISIVLFLYLKNIVKSKYGIIAIISLIFIIDMLPITHRVVTNDDYVTKAAFENYFSPRTADLQIQQAEPKGRGYYRVFDLSVNTFNDAKSCYYHNQIGGYSAVKMQRYQDIIERHLSKNNIEVLNMLNGKYIIMQDGKVQTNVNANGPAWFVNNVKYVESNIDEINALNEVKTKEVAVIKRDEFGEVKAGSGNGSIELKAFTPNKMTYLSSSDSKQLAVFSETWYNGETGWVATIDGEEAPILRANYILRAMEIPSGNHEIVMEFRPEAKGSFISISASFLSITLILGSILLSLGLIDKNKVIENKLN